MLGFLNKKTQTVSASDNSGDAVAENDDDILEVIRSKLRNDNRAESQDRRAHKSSINQGVGHNARTIFTSGDMQDANFNAATSQSVSQGFAEWQSTGNANNAGDINIDLHKVDEVRDEFEETFHAAHKNISEASFHDATQSSNNVYINELPEHKNEMWHKEDVMDDIDEYAETNDVAENSMQNVQNHSVDSISVKSDQSNNIDHMNEQMHTSNIAYEDETRSVSNLQQNVANLTPTTQANSKLQSQDFIAPEELSTHEGFWSTNMNNEQDVANKQVVFDQKQEAHHNIANTDSQSNLPENDMSETINSPLQKLFATINTIQSQEHDSKTANAQVNNNVAIPADLRGMTLETAAYAILQREIRKWLNIHLPAVTDNAVEREIKRLIPDEYK